MPDSDSSAYWTAIELGDVSLIEAIAQQGVPINAPSDRNRDRLYPLHFAAQLPSPAAVRALTTIGAQLEVVDAYGSTPLQLAVAKSRLDEGQSVMELLGRGADALHINRSGGTAVARAQRLAGAPDGIVEALLASARARLERLVGVTRTLHSAAEEGDANVIRSALESATTVDERDERGRTALAIVVARTFPARPGRVPAHPLQPDAAIEYIGMLCGAGADPRALSVDGFTPQGSAREFLAPKVVVQALDSYVDRADE
jgi:hypothetical protein